MEANEKFTCTCAKPKCAKCKGVNLSEYHFLAEKFREKALIRLSERTSIN